MRTCRARALSTDRQARRVGTGSRQRVSNAHRAGSPRGHQAHDSAKDTRRYSTLTTSLPCPSLKDVRVEKCPRTRLQTVYFPRSGKQYISPFCKRYIFPILQTVYFPILQTVYFPHSANSIFPHSANSILPHSTTSLITITIVPVYDYDRCLTAQKH